MSKSLRILGRIRGDGYKLTQVRQFIVPFLTKSDRPLSAGEILQALGARVRQVNKTTVYRELQFLQQQGVVTNVDFGDRKKRYELAAQPHHHHAVCKSCGRIENIQVDRAFAKLEKKILRHISFTTLDHQFDLVGLCSYCAPAYN